MNSLIPFFGLEGRGIVSIVGAGGKTTLMFRLARELKEEGIAVLTTTTTKIRWPTKTQSPLVFVDSTVEKLLADIRPYIAVHYHVTAGKRFSPQEGKIYGFHREEVEALFGANLFTWVIVEADGAASRPLKAPAPHEPVIPQASSVVIAVVGLDVLGKPLEEEWVFRSDLFSAITGLDRGSPITKEAIVAIISHPAGLFKGSPPEAKRYVFLNKAISLARKKQGEAITTMLLDQKRYNLKGVIIGAVLKNDFTFYPI